MHRRFEKRRRTIRTQKQEITIYFGLVAIYCMSCYCNVDLSALNATLLLCHIFIAHNETEIQRKKELKKKIGRESGKKKAH